MTPYLRMPTPMGDVSTTFIYYVHRKDILSKHDKELRRVVYTTLSATSSRCGLVNETQFLYMYSLKFVWSAILLVS